MRKALLVIALVLALPVSAQAASVALIDNGEIWLVSPDAQQRKRLSPAPAAPYRWDAVAQSDNGRVLGYRTEPGKISTINGTSLWEPDGRPVYEAGTLGGESGWTIYAFPLSLDLTANGVHAVYGYSNSRGSFPMQFDRGTYLGFVNGPAGTTPYKLSGPEWPTLVGTRLVVKSGTQVHIQKPDGAPFTQATDFDPWIETSGTGMQLERTDVAATGTIAAAQLVNYAPGTSDVTSRKIAMIPVAGPGGAVQPGDCFLPAQGFPTNVTLSQDGALVAWQDDRGVVVAGVPDFSGAEPCNLTKPPVVISATGKYPSFGPASAAPPAGPAPGAGGPGTPAPGGGTTTSPAPAPTAPRPGTSSAPRVSLPSAVRATALRSGLTLRVTVRRAGVVSAVGRVKGKVVARGSVRARRAGTVSLKLRATRSARRTLRRLRGARMQIRVTAAGRSTTLTRRLR